MTTPYSTFSDLVLHAAVDVDYRLVVHQPSRDLAVVAVHGGAIEPLTGELATAIAGDEHSRYVLEGLRPADNDQLRIPLAHYDELRLRSLLQRSLAALAIEGITDQRPRIGLGGSNGRLKEELSQALVAAGWQVGRLATPGVAHDPHRFYNWPRQGGVLLELPRDLRMSLVDRPLSAPGWQQPEARTEGFARLVAAIREALARYLTAARVDLDATMARFERDTERIPRELRSDSHGGH